MRQRGKERGHPLCPHFSQFVTDSNVDAIHRRRSTRIFDPVFQDWEIGDRFNGISWESIDARQMLSQICKDAPIRLVSIIGRVDPRSPEMLDRILVSIFDKEKKKRKKKNGPLNPDGANNWRRSKGESKHSSTSTIGSHLSSSGLKILQGLWDTMSATSPTPID